MRGDAQEALMASMGFSVEDLAANRNGRLSDTQRRRMRGNARGFLFVTLAAGLLFAAGICLAGRQPLTLQTMVIAAVIGGALMAMGVLLFGLLSQETQQTAVRCLTGRLKASPRRYGFALRVGHEQLLVAADLRALIEEDSVYNVYYVPANRMVVSIERATGPHD